MTPNLRPTTYRILAPVTLFFSIVIGLPLLCCGGMVLGTPFYNDLRLARLANAFAAYPLPPRTTLLQKGDITWWRPVNGGTCIVSVEHQLLTALPREEFTAYYADVFFPPLRNIRARDDNRIGVEVHWPDAPEPDGRHKVRISAGEPFFDAGFDSRCPT